MFAKSCHTLPQKPWSPLNPHPCARAADTFEAWQFEVKTAQKPPVQGLTVLGVRTGAARTRVSVVLREMPGHIASASSAGMRYTQFPTLSATAT